MIYFQPVRTARFTFTLQELTIADIQELLNIPTHLLETTRSAFLRFAIKELTWHKGYSELSIDHLTAQERIFIEATYLSSVSDVPDFNVGNGHYTNYLQVEKQYKLDQVEIGQIPDDEDLWFIQPLTGAMLDVIEERLFMADKTPNRADWFLYTMAAQFFRKEEEVVSPYLNAINYGDWLESRVERLRRLPESAFCSLLMMFIYKGMKSITHLFDINLDNQGVIIQPSYPIATNKKGEEVELLPARFRSTDSISDPAKQLFGKFDQDG
ncbi:hypothetical protein ACU6T4_05790 [Avibacterium paragallinarum]|uniref:hypothetical protein n=1 Tax=Avibacterium paragallinarum TaxID=728 RepID=UPI00021ACDC2|nr:hypothetical protein [Avibacterium paragallinarum]AZI14503.1 hypothetical protein EIA51_07695 [Avibacterium paragallinarum]QIR11159.1 hypothetical protein HBL79_02245 [Avibacterium paragallinarum]QJE10020.1 hypothetical protein HHJ62_06780 [Avibacterium paragallinarum]QJE12215.1 hypothetical protein HHJ61_06785 [Avibacterium paragallinarum]QJE14416.1 hypothetical protein HHJ60_06800 [Avibacterium paragallinarum]